jgi:rRNA maturation endonuclease Nob1
MKYCNKCNKNFSDKEKKCPACGNKLVRLAY